MGFWYEIEDFFTTSENERKRDYYKKLIKTIDEKMPYINQYIAKAEEASYNMDVYRVNDAILYGTVMDKFYNTTSKIYTTSIEEIEVVRVYKDTLIKVRDDARILYSIYENKCIEEDKEGRDG